jgi:hypothetical protein
MSPPSSRPNNKEKSRALLTTNFRLVSVLAYSSTLKMETICFSETPVDFQRAIWRYIPEDELFIATAVRTSNLFSLSF